MYYLIFPVIIVLWLSWFNVGYLYDARRKLINQIPGPVNLPFLGNLLELCVNSTDLFELLRVWYKKYYPTYKFWIGTTPLIVISHPHDVEIILSSSRHVDRDHGYRLLKPWMDNGLLLSNGCMFNYIRKKYRLKYLLASGFVNNFVAILLLILGKLWQYRRKMLTKAFHFNILQKCMQIINEEAEKIRDNEKEEKERSIDLLPFCSTHTLNIICQSAMGVSLDDPEDEEATKKYKEGNHKMGEIFGYRQLRPFIKDWMLPLLPKLNKINNESIRDINYLTNKIVHERREYHKNSNYAMLNDLDENDISESEFDASLYGQKKKLSMLDLLLDSERNNLINDEGIKAEVTTCVFAGHDTTAICLFYTILLLAEHEDIQSKCRAEIEEILLEKQGKLKISDLQNMIYLEKCIKESLRLYPSVPAISRLVKENVQLKHYLAPKNTNVIMHICDTHRNPEFWPDPDKFDPERFSVDAMKTRHPFSYVPFSAGPRNCIGQKFAMMEMKSLLARVLYNFYLQPIDKLKDFKIMLDVVLRPDRPVKTKFIKIYRE